MNKIYHLIVMFLALSYFTTHAQVNGIASDPVVSTETDTVYFYIESASDASYEFGGFTGDFRGNVIISPEEPGKLIHNTLETAPSPAHAQWAIIMVDGDPMLQNKATKLYMTASHSCSVEAKNKYIYTAIGENQFVMRTADQPSYTITWKNNLLDRLNIGLDQNGLVAWYFIPADEAQLNEILKLSLFAKIGEANTLYQNTKEGYGFAEYSTNSRENFEEEIQNAQYIYDEAASVDEIQVALNAIGVAKENYIASISLDLSSFIPEDNSKYRWYWIRSYATGEEYCFNKVMSYDGVRLKQSLTYKDKAELPADKQLFRFELTDDQTRIKAIVTLDSTFVMPNGLISDTLYSQYTFSFDPQTDGIAFWIDPAGPTELATLYANPGEANVIGNWKYLTGGPSSWVFDFAYEDLIIPEVETARTITTSAAQPTMGSAMITETGETAITTKVKSVSVTATPNKGYFFTRWTNLAGDSVSTLNPYTYTGEEAISLVAEFENGYYGQMSRFFTGPKPTVQVLDRYLTDVTAIVNEVEQPIVVGVDTIPNPVDTSVVTNQLLQDAVVDYTAVPIEITLNTDSFEMRFVGSNASNETLKWTQQVVFVDWDKDFNFTSEGEASTRSSESGGIPALSDPEGFTKKIGIPEGVQEGVYRMRVVYHEPASTADWTTTIWEQNTIRNGVAFDFSVRYGEPSSVENAMLSNIKAYVSGEKLMVLNGQNSQVNIYDATGKTVAAAAITSDLQAIRLPASNGMYIMKLIQAKGNVVTFKVLK